MRKSISLIFGRKFKNIDVDEISKIKINLRELTIPNIKFILQKSIKERTEEDISYLKNFVLLKTKFNNKLIEEHISDQFQEIIMILSMKDSFYQIIKNENEILYDMNDESKYFYIILNGKVGVYGIEKLDCEMSPEEYYKLILNLRNNKEKYLLERTIRENKVNIPIDLNDVNRLDKILLKIYLLSKKSLPNYKNNPHFLDEIFEKLGFKYSDFDIQSYEEFIEQQNQKIREDSENEENEEKLLEYKLEEAIKMSKSNEDKVLENISFDISDNLFKKYSFLIKTHDLPISYYRYKEKQILNNMDYFGESYLGNYKDKIIAKSKNLELLCFKNDIYNEYDLNMKLKFSGPKNHILLSNFFFSSISKSNFIKVYLKYFEYIKYYSNQIIVEENETFSHIYFIKSGNVKLYSNRSIIQNHLLIQLIINIMKQKYPEFIKKYPKLIEYSELNVDFHRINKEININKDIHIMNIDEKQCLGFECFYFGFNSLYTAKAVSEKVEVYRISLEKLFKILSKKNKKALYEFALQAEKTLKIFLDRLITMNNMLIIDYTKKSTILKKEAGDYMEKELQLIRQKIEEKRGINNTKYSRTRELKKLEHNNSCHNFNYKYNYSELKGKNLLLSYHKKRTSKFHLRKNLKFNKIQLIDSTDSTKINNKFKGSLGLNIKIFDYRANLVKQRNRELLRESIELERLSNADNKFINYLKLQNKISKDFVRLSRGENRYFINSNSNINLSTIKKNYGFKKRNILIDSRNKIKNTKFMNTNSRKREFLPKFTTSQLKSNIMDSNNDIVISEKWIELVKNKENASTNTDKDIENNEKVNVFKKTSDGKNNIYKKFVIPDLL